MHVKVELGGTEGDGSLVEVGVELRGYSPGLAKAFFTLQICGNRRLCRRELLVVNGLSFSSTTSALVAVRSIYSLLLLRGTR